MARDRILTASSRKEDEPVDVALRPKHLTEMVGQRHVIDQLQIAIHAALSRKEPLEHVLLDGPPGLGKTTLASVIAQEMTGRAPRITSGPALAKQADLMALLTNLATGDILFIDEIHRLPRPVEEFLYPAMEDFRVDFTIEGGMSGRVVNFALKRFTLIGATTRPGMLTNAMRDRFGHHWHLDFYPPADLLNILQRSARQLQLTSHDDALQLIALRSRGTPRVANRMLKRVRDYAQVRSDGVLTVPITHEALNILRVDSLGLDDLDRKYLTVLMEVYEGGPAGVEAMSASLGLERDTLEDVVEPYLLQTQFLARTRQGRVATRAAYEHLGRSAPASLMQPEEQDSSSGLFG